MDTNDLSIIYDKLLVIHQMMNNNLNEQARLLGYNTSEYLVLMDLAVHPDTDLTSLYSRLGMKKSAVSKIVQNLVERDIITRQEDRDDKRKVHLALSESIANTICKHSAVKQAFAGIEQKPCDLANIQNALDDVIAMLDSKNQTV